MRRQNAEKYKRMKEDEHEKCNAMREQNAEKYKRMKEDEPEKYKV